MMIARPAPLHEHGDVATPDLRREIIGFPGRGPLVKVVGRDLFHARDRLAGGEVRAVEEVQQGYVLCPLVLVLARLATPEWRDAILDILRIERAARLPQRGFVL